MVNHQYHTYRLCMHQVFIRRLTSHHWDNGIDLRLHLNYIDLQVRSPVNNGVKRSCHGAASEGGPTRYRAHSDHVLMTRLFVRGVATPARTLALPLCPGTVRDAPTNHVLVFYLKNLNWCPSRAWIKASNKNVQKILILGSVWYLLHVTIVLVYVGYMLVLSHDFISGSQDVYLCILTAMSSTTVIIVKQRGYVAPVRTLRLECVCVVCTISMVGYQVSKMMFE